MLSGASEPFNGKSESRSFIHSRKEKKMAETDRIKYLPSALLVVGLIFIVGI